MRYLFGDWNGILQKIQKSPRVFLFFDYDGTLTPIVSTPEKARFPCSVKDSLRKLRKNPKFRIAIISGRSLKNIKKMAGLKGIIYAGNHGLEIESQPGRVLRPRASSTGQLLKKIKIGLQKGLRHIRGAGVEDKGCTLSVHFRLVNPRNRSLVKKIFTKAVKSYEMSKKIRVSSGKMVLEVRPGVDWDKGRAVLYLLRRAKNALPIYIGDDVTDIDAFRAIKGRGISIFVGRPKKSVNADYFLKNPRDVGRFINKLTA